MGDICENCGDYSKDCECKWEDTEEGQDWMNAPMGRHIESDDENTKE